MTRIIGGSAGGRRVATPSGDGTRPTTDRVREALFSAFVSRVGSLAGRSFLDLYAGSGAVGLEAASRGARPVILVESDRKAASVITANLRTLDLAEVRLAAEPVRRFLAQTPTLAFDIVFCDPPYSASADVVAADLEALSPWLAPGAVVVVERPARERDWTWPGGYQPERDKRYGETMLRWASCSQRPSGAGEQRPPADGC